VKLKICRLTGLLMVLLVSSEMLLKVLLAKKMTPEATLRREVTAGGAA
jgi:hypothetical protein